jgi:hypothetical protein
VPLYLITKKYVRFTGLRVIAGVDNELLALGNVNTGNPFSVDVYVIVDEAFVALFPKPLLSIIVVTFDPVKVTVALSAGSNHNWHP